MEAIEGPGNSQGKRLKNKPTRTHEEWENIFQAIGHPTLILTPDQKITSVNLAAIKVTGKPMAELVGKKCWEIFHRTDQPPSGCPFEKMVRSGHLEAAEMEIEALGRTFLVSCTPVLDAAGKLERVIHIATDITEHKRVEDAQRESEEKYRTLTEQSLVGIVVIQDTSVTFANDALAEISGYSVEELLSLPPAKVQALIHPEDQTLAWGRVQDQLTGKAASPQYYQFRIIRKDGAIRWLEVHSNRIEYGGKPALQGVFIDITNRKQAEIKYKNIIETAFDGFWTTDLRGRFLDVNDQYCLMIGYTREELLKMGITDVEAVEKPKETAEHVKRVIEQGYDRFETRHRRKDGKIIELEISTTYSEAHGGQLIVFIRDITERKRAEESLRRSEQNFRDSIEKSPLGIRIVTENGRTLYVNKALLDICGYGSLEKLKTVSRNRLYTPESYAEHKERVNKRKRREYVPPDYEISIVRKDGQVRWLSVSRGEVLWDGEKQFQVVYQDITESKQAEEALQWSQAQYQDLYYNAPVAYYSLDTDGRIKRANKVGLKFLGYSQEELQRMKFLELYADESKAKADKLFRRFRQGIGWENEEMVYLRKNRERVHGLLSVSPIIDENGQVLESRSVIVDVTKRKKAEEALEKSEERYRQLAENAGEAIFVIQDDVIKFINPKGAELSGYSIEELASRPFAKFIHSNDIDMVVDRYTRRLRGESIPQIYDFRFIRKDGDIRWGALNAVPILWENQPAVLCFINDITERKKAEEALRQSEERYRAILEKMEDSYFEVGLTGNLTFVNSSTCHNLGYSREKLIGMSYKSFTAEDYIKPISKIFKEVYRTATPNKGFNWKIIRKDGSPGLIDTSVTPLRNDNGEIIGFSGVGRDITERKKMEEQLMLTDRLASIGQLAAGIAHELNNPLTAIIGFSDLLLEKDIPRDVKADLETVNQEARRTVNIVKGLLTFARQQRIEKAPVNINSIIQGVLQLRSYEQRVHNIEVDARLASAPPPVMGNGAQLQQVFINIIINAEQAMLEAHNKGKLTITTERIGDIVRASITDDGPGISPNNIKNLFTPFFTTREVGKGTGLGLSICHGIVTEHGGKLYVESEPGKGATFVVELLISK